VLQGVNITGLHGILVYVVGKINKGESRIEVDRTQLLATAAAISEYCTLHDTQITNANNAVQTMLAQHWHGTDANAFGVAWSSTRDGTISNIRTHMDSFAQGLIAAEAEYRQAQINAISSAGLLMNLIGG